MIIIEVYAPSVDASYDFQVDENIKASDAVIDLCDLIARKNGSCRETELNVSLYDTADQRELDPENTLKDSGIVSGMKLLLV